MSENNEKNKNTYDDGNIPDVDLPGSDSTSNGPVLPVEPLPASSRPRKDGPGGE